MARYRVFDQNSARLISAHLSGEDSVDLGSPGEYFSANPGDVILAPSVNDGEVLYIRIRTTSKAVASPLSPAPTREPSRHYVATGFLGLDTDLEEEVPEPPKPWWKRLFID